MESTVSLKEKEVIVDIERDDGSNTQGVGMEGNPRRGKKSLNKLMSGALVFKNRLSIDTQSKNKNDMRQLGRNLEERIELLVDNKSRGEQRQKHELMMPDAGKKQHHHKKDKRMPSKPPRPPKAPTLDAADMRLVREMSMIAMKKREQIQRMKALNKLKISTTASSQASNSSTWTIFAMVTTFLFFLLIILQGLGSESNSSSETTNMVRSPQPALELKGLSPTLHYTTGGILSNECVVTRTEPPNSKTTGTG